MCCVCMCVKSNKNKERGGNKVKYGGERGLSGGEECVCESVKCGGGSVWYCVCGNSTM